MPPAPRTAAPAAAATTAREAVTEKGADLLALIDAAEQDENNADEGLRLTQPEAHEAESAGFVQVDKDTFDPATGTAVVKLTDAGRANLATGDDGQAQVSGSTAPATGGKYNVRTDIPVPTNLAPRRRTSENSYPFGTMPLKGTFHVPKTAEEPNPITKVSSSVSVARNRFSEPTDEMETVMKKTYQKNDNGKGLKTDENGKRIVTGEEEVTQPKRRLTRDFLVAEVDATDPEGPGVRVWRTL